MNRFTRYILTMGLPVIFFSTSPAQAEIKEVLAYADGLYCEFCTLAVLRQIRVLPGVDKVNLLLRDGAFQITLKEGHPFQPEEIIRVIGKSSYNFTDMQVLVTGKNSGGQSLSVPENEVTFKLEDGENMTLKAKKVLDGAASGELTIIGSYKVNESDPEKPILLVESATPGKTTKTSILSEE